MTSPTAPQASWLDEIPARLADIERAHLRVDGQPMLAFCSNDYLGLAGHPALAQAACEATQRFGVGSGGSPLVSGHSAANDALEHDLAAYVQLPRALYFYAGYATNTGINPALVGGGDALLSDALNHACLIDGARLSRATIHRYLHADLAALEAQLAACPARRKRVISEAVFSMDGDLIDIPALLALCERYDALLLLDDAHGFGVLGPQGRGSLAQAGLTGPNASHRVLYMATLGKAAGVAGAFVAGDAALIEWLLQKTRTYIFATAAPPVGKRLAQKPGADCRCGRPAGGAAPAHRPIARRPGHAAPGTGLAPAAIPHGGAGARHRQQRSGPGGDGKPAPAGPVGARHPPAHSARRYGPAAHCAVGRAHRGRCG